MSGRRAKMLRKYVGLKEGDVMTRLLYRMIKRKWTRFPSPLKQFAARLMNERS